MKREWTHARAHGVKVSPVLADGTVRKRDLQSWIRRCDVYGPLEPERWAMLISVLHGSGEIRRVPYTTGDLPPSFVSREEVFRRLKEVALSTAAESAVALTTALQGVGGYGKTTLANALCRDDDVRAEFSDGIEETEVGLACVDYGEEGFWDF